MFRVKNGRGGPGWAGPGQSACARSTLESRKSGHAAAARRGRAIWVAWAGQPGRLGPGQLGPGRLGCQVADQPGRCWTTRRSCSFYEWLQSYLIPGLDLTLPFLGILEHALHIWLVPGPRTIFTRLFLRNSYLNKSILTCSWFVFLGKAQSRRVYITLKYSNLYNVHWKKRRLFARWGYGMNSHRIWKTASPTF